MELPNEHAIEIEPGLRRMLLIEIIFPMVLLILGIYHGLMQVLYRAGIIRSSQFLGLEYFQGLTLHGVVNAIVFTTFFAVAFGYAVVRYHLGRPLNMKVAWLSFALMMIGTVLAAAAILSGKATVLYTFYPPLRAHPAFYVGLVLVVVGSWIAFFNWLPPYFAWKREHPGEKIPLAVVGIFATFIVWLIATIPVAIEILFMLIPWSMGWVGDGQRPARADALLVLWPSACLFLAAADLRHVLHDAAQALRRKTLFRFCRPPDLSLARCSIPLRSGFITSSRSPESATLGSSCTPSLPCWWRSRVLLTAFTMAASMEHGAIQNGGRGLLGWWKKLPYLDQGPLALFVSLFRAGHFHLWRGHRHHQCVLQSE